MFFLSKIPTYAVRSRRGFFPYQFGAESGTEFQGPEVEEKLALFLFTQRHEILLLLSVLRGLRENGEGPERKAEGYGFFQPCSDFASVHGGGWWRHSECQS